MENLKIIKNRLKTVDTIIKATNAMKIVSTVKLSRLNNKNKFSNDCSNIILDMLKRVIRESIFIQDFENNIWFKRNSGKTLVIVLSTDQGFCGSFSQNIINLANNVIKDNPEPYIEVFGKKANAMKQSNIVEDKFDIKAFAKLIADLAYDYIINKGVYKLFVISSEFKNVLVQKPKCSQIFPIEIDNQTNEYLKIECNIYHLLDDLLYEYLLKFFTGCITEHLFSELSARVMAMDHSVKNAKNMLDELRILYNRIRQAKITQELTEIVSSVECVQ
ncbi:MAG: F0F1 ATP synthase subunit gamma [Holosporales bacterium]|jgi:F-type H+-transporting ATPase subunit gamma|nr:F0F1 ATP synthase subunit gamma [Holosporales bacterium]